MRLAFPLRSLIVVMPWVVFGTFPTAHEARAAELANVTAVAIGSTQNCAVTAATGVKCWGYGYLGDGVVRQSTKLTKNASDPVEVAGLVTGVVDVTARGQSTCVLTAAAGVKCWGPNDFGELGDGTMTPRASPVDVVGLSSGVMSVRAAVMRTCALMVAGTVKCWGAGPLGTPNQLTPTDVTGFSGVLSIAVDWDTVCALTSAHGVKCATVGAAPADVPGLTSGVAGIFAGSQHFCAVTSTGAAKCWGNNAYGQLGDGSRTPRSSPVDVVGLSSVVSMAIGDYTTCAVLAAGALKCWGTSVWGQVGDNFTSVVRVVPTDVDAMASGVVTVASGGATTCATRANGDLRCWGSDNRDTGPLEDQGYPKAVTLPGQSQTISFAPIPSHDLVDAPFTISATASSGLPVTFESVTERICSVSGSTVTLLAVGTCTIEARQPGDGSIASAFALQSFRVIGSPPGVSPRLVNISTRAHVGTGNDVLIAGFVIGGSTNKSVLIQALAPSLFSSGITNALTNPTIRVVRSSDGRTVATNNDWPVADFLSPLGSNRTQQIGMSPASNLEAALYLNLEPGAYTAIVSDAGGQSGVGLVAVYEIDRPETPLANISTRGQVLANNDVMIAGFVIQGPNPQTVVITGIGPSLASAGVSNALADPTLELWQLAGHWVNVATNDDWGSASNASAIQAAGFAPGNAKESAIMMTLQPGAYTAILSGAGGSTGVGIVAVYAQ